MTTWNENLIAGYLASQTFQNKALVMVPRCGWTNHECDLLVLTKDLRIIDVEIKVSVKDFKADAKKDKWFHSWDWEIDGPFLGHKHQRENRRPRELPRKIWKHYFCVPREIWGDELVEFLPSKSCGVITVWQSPRKDGRIVCEVRRKAKPAKDAERVSPEAAIDIARLANIRTWNAFRQLEAARREVETLKQILSDGGPG